MDWGVSFDRFLNVLGGYALFLKSLSDRFGKIIRTICWYHFFYLHAGIFFLKKDIIAFFII